MKRLISAAVAAILVFAAQSAHAGATFDAVKARGQVNCGVNTGLAGFSAPDERGVWRGIDVDVCRAVAAAMFGDATKVRYVPLTAQQRFTALQSGEIDVLSRNTTWTSQRDIELGLNFTGVTYYDGQGFLVAKKLNVKSAKELNGATVCVLAGTTTELNLADWFRANNLQFRPVVIEKNEELAQTFFANRCDAITSDASQLAAIRASSAPNPDDFMILPEIISKEPLGPAVRHGDDQWFDLVKWSLFAMIQAEEKGITSKNIDSFKDSPDPEIKRILGITPGQGKALGVDDRWAANIIRQVGNYGESFERNVGKDSKLKLERGLNALWTNGGLMYAMPIR
ncbi:MAG TPA: amino acid ABC transporter substrate-binding protein [Alphaproteobacteria bacterium]|jgi:general L-amino acid transport system substrate-binding protein|nr:amino acid ABC transporter substrate-binding protein [Alphaproteobacteria bacterium]